MVISTQQGLPNFLVENKKFILIGTALLLVAMTLGVVLRKKR